MDSLLGSHPQASSDSCPYLASGLSQAEGMALLVPPLALTTQPLSCPHTTRWLPTNLKQEREMAASTF